VVAHSEIPFWHLLGRTKEYYTKVKIIGITVEIRIGNLANTSVKHPSQRPMVI
jgi:hypothetical protein